MWWKEACPTYGRDVVKSGSPTRIYEGTTFRFDSEECANVFDGTGSIWDVYEKISDTGRKAGPR
jgi:hypothetical protein